MALFKRKNKDNQEGVYFPPFFKYQKHSNLLLSFFQINNINVNDDYFRLDILRNLYQKDYNQFELIKTELVLKGFNFVTKKPTSLFPKVLDYDNEPIILNLKEGRLTPTDLNKFGLFRHFSQLGWYDREYLNFIPNSRLSLFTNKTGILSEKYEFQIFDDYIKADQFNQYQKKSREIEDKSSSETETEYDTEEIEEDNILVDEGEELYFFAESDENDTPFYSITDTEINNYLKFKNLCDVDKEKFFANSEYFSDDELPYWSNGIPNIWLYLLVETARNAPKIYETLSKTDDFNLETLMKTNLETLEKKVINLINSSSHIETYYLNVFLGFLKHFIAKRDKILLEITEWLRDNDISNVNSYDILIYPKVFLDDHYKEFKNNDGINGFAKICSKYIMFNYSSEQLSNLDYQLSASDIERKNLSSIDNIGVASSIVDLLTKTNIVNLSDFISLRDSKALFYQSIVENPLFQEVEWLWIFKLIDSEIKMKPCNINNEVQTYLMKEENIWHAFLQDNFLNQLDEGRYSKTSSIDIVKMREGYNSEKKKTLEEIGNEFNITRERVRQRQKKLIEVNKNIFDKVLNVFMATNQFIPIDKIIPYIGLQTYLSFGQSSFTIIEDLDIIVENSRAKVIEPYLNRLLDKTAVDTHEIIKFKKDYNFPLDYFINNFSCYSLVGKKYINKEKISLRELASHILIELGKEGFNENSKDFARQRMKELLNESSISDRNLYTYFTNHYDSVIKDRSTYIHSSFITEEQINVVEGVLEDYQFNNGYISSKQIYNENQEVLSSVGIDNYRFLYGIITSFNIKGLQSTGVSMKLGYGEKQTFEDIVHEFSNNYGDIMPIPTLKKRLNLNDVQINNLLNNEVLYKLDSDTVVTTRYFKLKSQEKSLLKHYIEELLEENNQAFTTTTLYNTLQFDSKMTQLLATHEIVYENKTNYRLLYFINHVFPNDYEYNSHLKLISKKDLKINKIFDFAAYQFKGKTFSREEIKTFYIENDFRTNQIPSFLKEHCFQYDEESYRLKEDAVMPDKITDIIDFIDAEFKDEVFISATDILVRMHIRDYDILDMYQNRPILLTSHISEFSESPYVRPEKDYGQPNEHLQRMLINTKITKSDSMSKGIREYIKHNFEKDYVTFEELNEKLSINDIIPRPLKKNTIEDIFEESSHTLFIEVDKL